MTTNSSEARCKGCGEALAAGTTVDPNFCVTCETVAVYEGYTREQLRNWFDSVSNKQNWKFPIDATFPTGGLAKAVEEGITAAVVFYAGCTPSFTREWDLTARRWIVRVTAVGYYAAVGA